MKKRIRNIELKKKVEEQHKQRKLIKNNKKNLNKK